MAALSPEKATIASTNAAKDFVESFYPSLNKSRDQLTSFYQPTAAMPDGKTIPIIVWNGNVIPDPVTLQKVFEEQMPKSYYKVQSYDCHVLNPNYDGAGLQDGSGASAKNMSILVTVSGSVKYGDAPTQRGFSETFILVPNPDAAQRKARNAKGWLIQSQNFRLVV